jgi:hypothetical protein
VLNVYGKALLCLDDPCDFSPPVALISQSGGLSTTIANALMLNRHVGLSHIISCGNQAGATLEEYINYFVEDDNTRVIAVFAEGFKQPEKLLTVARKAAERNKPPLFERRLPDVSNAPPPPTWVAAGAEVVDAVFRQGGIARCAYKRADRQHQRFPATVFVHSGGRGIGVRAVGRRLTPVSTRRRMSVSRFQLTGRQNHSCSSGCRLRQHEQSAGRHRRQVRRRQDFSKTPQA